MTRRFEWTLVIGLVAICYVFPMCPALRAESILLQNEVIELALAPHAGDFCVQGLAERTTGTAFIRRPGPGPLWMIELCDRDANAVEVSSKRAGRPSVEYTDRVMQTLLWQRIAVGQEAEALSVRVRVRLDERDPQLSH